MSNTFKQTKLQDSLSFFSSTLFHDAQMAGLFKDSKTMADAIPRVSYKSAEVRYEQEKTSANFDLSQFIELHFHVPKELDSQPQVSTRNLQDYLAQQWDKLTRNEDPQSIGSLIGLDHPYVVPGGRFREIYYWDSYFTCLGLAVSKRIDLVKSITQNFIDIQNVVGLIPNGNRAYYASRSQPPVLMLMLELLLKEDESITCSADNVFFQSCLNAVETEYAMWMDGSHTLVKSGDCYRRVAKVGEFVLNRYYDDSATPRPESYCEDIELAQTVSPNERPHFYRSLRAACESGWDFSSRWLEDDNFNSIHTTDIIPVDLNALLYKVEADLSRYYEQLNNRVKAQDYANKAEKRAQAINNLLWNAKQQFYFDYDFKQEKLKNIQSLAAVVPLFVGISHPVQAESVHNILMRDFLKTGGLVTTPLQTGQQWDAPNGWAPLQYFASKGMQNYGFNTSATRVKRAWLQAISASFANTNTLFEKYDVENPLARASGGEYEVQEGFGWTNGITLHFLKDLENVNDLN